MNTSILRRKYGTQQKCIAHLEKLRWGKHPICAYCDSPTVSKRRDGFNWHCSRCNRDSTALVNTIFEGTKMPLPKFFEIILFMINAKMGISASEIARNVGVKYQTAWYACHRIRCAMIEHEIRLEGLVEFDEAYVGASKGRVPKGKENKANLSNIALKRGRGTNKTPIVGAVEKKGKVYVKIIEKLTGRNLYAMLKEVVKTNDTVVFTDNFKSYKAFDEAVEHITIDKSDGKHGHGVKTINTIEGFWSILKNGIRGSFRSISKKYLPFYLAEFSYKYNQRHIQKESFDKLLENAVKVDKEMVNYKPIRNPRKIVYG